MKIQLREALLPTSSRSEAAQRLGVDEDTLQRILVSEFAYRDGRHLDYEEFSKKYPDEDFYDSCGVKACPDDLKVTELDVPRDVHQRLDAPITKSEVIAIQIIGLQRFLDAFQSHGAPSVIQANSLRMMQSAFESAGSAEWSEADGLMTGSSPDAGALGEPLAEPPLIWQEPRDPSIAVDGAIMKSSILIQFPYLSVVIGTDGVIRDAFPTSGLRLVDSDERYALMTIGGGNASQTGYFDGAAYVRDLSAKEWVTGSIPDTLSPYIAGTIGDVKWSVVVDASRGMGYQMSPFNSSDMCGGTFNSACSQFAYDGGDFVLEASSGTPILDARQLDGELVCFARLEDGWRFVLRDMLEEDWDDEDEGDYEEPIPAVRLVDDLGQCIRVLDEDTTAMAFSKDGRQLLQTTGDELELRDTETGKLIRAFDLRGIRPSLEMPGDSDLWHRLTAVAGIPFAVGHADLFSSDSNAKPEELLQRIHCSWAEDPSLEEIQSAIEAGSRKPGLPASLPEV